MHILGVTHPISWNPAACLLADGVLIAFAEEERFIRLKHAPHVYPAEAIRFCLEKAGLSVDHIDITAVGFEQPTAQHARNANAESYVAGAVSDSAWFDFHTGLAHIYGDTQLKSYGQRLYVDHHLCHAASAAIPSGFARTNLISLDGWGGKASGWLGLFDRSGGLETLRLVEPRYSWGATYELITDYLGFRCHSGEGKTMGLAPYGRADGRLLPDFCEPELGLPDVYRYEAYMRQHFTRRRDDEELNDRHRDLAATVQHYYERSLLRIAEWLMERTGCRTFSLAGGVALNCSGNGRLARQQFVDDLFVQPASHDAGTALGAAILAHRQFAGAWPELSFPHAYWGPSYSSDEIKAALDFAKAPYQVCDPAKTAAEALARNEIVGWYQGATEIGPRALGNRSILAHPGRAENLQRINQHVKRRELWRPLAPSVLADRCHELFDVRQPTPFMLLAGQVRPHWQARLPAIVHVDGSARPQAVCAETNPVFYQLIWEFEQLTELPAVLNTSFNHSDEPLVNSPEHAIATFYRTGVETLVIGNYVVRKAL
ncbi:MAG TPA: carbamoyltransferase C-terminal domain-containing protein [Pirellulales bacterium]|jgi:carbamoyltransferase|nr:carbamoyltransferase C-terminal domain-containing protein [Pirellulales bacterium]HEX4146455.1 carbamoyltransferase C-terminal domain-containing protein [Pirellulales bacterium]